MTAIRSAVETLLGGAAGDATARDRFLQIADRNAARMQQLVEDLLDLSRIESRQYKLSPEPIELDRAFSHTVSLARERASARRVVLEIEPSAPAAKADRRALDQVLANLVDNAIKYSGEGCTVKLRASRADSVTTVAIEDNGVGIEAQHLPRLFERFYRVDAGRSREQGGTGLGLSIVKHLVEAMGGKVSVKSEPGRGASFSFTLPAA